MKKIMIMAIACLLFAACSNNAEQTKEQAAAAEPAAAETKAPGPVELASPSYYEVGKKALAAMEKGDMDTWVADYADNAVYIWSSGDSLSGKAAILAYWKDRRTKVIDSITLSNDIWLAIKVNQPQRGPDLPGVWLMGWYQFNSKYKNGKRVGGWIHQDSHFNSDNKIDRVIQYIDRGPINKALGK